MKRLVLLLVSFISSCTYGMYHYRQANEADVPTLLALLEHASNDDRNKIVILPEPFRAAALQSAIKKERLFVATTDGAIIGYKKLFLISDQEEKNQLLQDEIRCIGPRALLTYAGRIDHAGQLHDLPPTHVDPRIYTTCIYNGGDFTALSHRGNGVNRELTNYALRAVLHDTQEHVQTHQADAITMVYGLTEANAGQEPGKSPDRTPSIAKSFQTFVNKMGVPVETTDHYRYRAFMPMFDPASTALRPLPDEQSIAGFGCVLSHTRK